MIKIVLVDRQGVARAVVLPGGKIPSGVIAGKDWTIRLEYDRGKGWAKDENTKF